MTVRPPTHVKYAGRTYIIELAVVMFLYVALLYVRPWLLDHVGGADAAMAIKLLPVLPIWLMFFIIVRHYWRIDEFARLKFLENASIAGGITACLVVSYSFFEDIGAPPLALFWAWPIFAVSWGLATAFSELRNR